MKDVNVARENEMVGRKGQLSCLQLHCVAVGLNIRPNV